MGDRLYHDEEAVASLVSTALQKIDDYEIIIDQLEKLVGRINSSTDWIDMEVKTAFIAQCNSYMMNYRAFIQCLHSQVEGYLSKKSTEIGNIERAYS